jgi:hypothetical protein
LEDSVPGLFVLQVVVLLLLLHTKVLQEKPKVKHILTTVKTGKLNMTSKSKRDIKKIMAIMEIRK